MHGIGIFVRVTDNLFFLDTWMAFYSLFLSFKVQLAFPTRAWTVLLLSSLLSIQKVQEIAAHMYHLIPHCKNC